MKQQSPSRIRRFPIAISIRLLVFTLLLVTSCQGQDQQSRTEEIVFYFGEKDVQIDPIQGAQAYREALERAGNPNFRPRCPSAKRPV